MSDLTDYEMTVLFAYYIDMQHMLSQGATLNQAMEVLNKGGYIDAFGLVTAKGSVAVSKWRKKRPLTPGELG